MNEKKFYTLIINQEKSIYEAMEMIDLNGCQVVFIITSDLKLVGICTDGDIRRGILKKIDLNLEVSQIMNENPIVAQSEDDRLKLKQMMHAKGVKYLPLVNHNGILRDILIYDQFKSDTYKNTVVLMAGGLGSRLGDLTKDCPKPLLPIGKLSIIETIIIKFREQGFRKFYLCLNYLADRFKEVLGDGVKLGVEIHYIVEADRLGTAGALSLLPKFEEPFIVMNSDLITDLNFSEILKAHNLKSALGTMCIRDHYLEVPFGVIKHRDDRIVDIEEKPNLKFSINAGIYVLDPLALNYIPKDTYLNMTDVFKSLIDNEEKIFIYESNDYWSDIGQINEYHKVVKENSDNNYD